MILKRLPECNSHENRPHIRDGLYASQILNAEILQILNAVHSNIP
jgi:hypothetical protein